MRTCFGRLSFFPDFFKLSTGGRCFIYCIHSDFFPLILPKNSLKMAGDPFLESQMPLLLSSSYFYHFCGCYFLIWHLCSVQVFSEEQLVVLVHLTKLFFRLNFFIWLGGFCRLLYKHKINMVIPAMTGLIYTISIILGGLIFSSAEGFAYGVLFGSIVGPFALPLYGCLKSGMRWSLSFLFPMST